MPPKKVDEPFQIPGSGLWFQRSGGKIHSRRVDGSRLGVTVAIPVKGWTDADRDAKIRAHKDFAELTAHAAAASSSQPVDVNQRPATQPSQAIGQRELRALGEVCPSTDDARSRKQPDMFMHSEHSERDDYKARNLGSRNGKVRDVSYDEATRRLEEMGLQAEAWLHEVRRVCVQMDIILDEIPLEQAAAVRALQAALIEMLDDAGEAADDDQSGESCEPCEPCEPSAPEESNTTEAERVAAAFFQEVTEAVGWSTDGAPPSPPLAVLHASYNGCAGGLLLTKFELLWIKAGNHFSEAQLRLPLREIDRAGASLLKSPFGSRAELLVSSRGERTPVRFACGSALADVELFSLELATAVAAIPGTAPVTTAAAAPAPPAAAAAPPVPRQTKQRLAAADLRQKLKQVVELQRSHAKGSSKEAAELLAELQAAPNKAPSIHTAYKQSEHLRDVALGFGGYAQARLVIEHFLKMPMVKLLLPDVLRELQQSSSDAKWALELMGYAREFFTEIFGVGFRGGRRCDEDRNAFAAASAALLPRDLFAKRGRAAAASRLTGLGYRQMHRGSDERRELEDRVGGWRRVRTAEHRDRIDWGPLKEAWHTDLLSTEDNQNKDMVSATSLHTTLTLTLMLTLPLTLTLTLTLTLAADPSLPRRRPDDWRAAVRLAPASRDHLRAARRGQDRAREESGARGGGGAPAAGGSQVCLREGAQGEPVRLRAMHTGHAQLGAVQQVARRLACGLRGLERRQGLHVPIA